MSIRSVRLACRGVVLLGLLFGFGASAACADDGVETRTIEVPPAGRNGDPKWCRVCHQDPVFSAQSWARSAHADVACRDCHKDYTFDPHEDVELSLDDDKTPPLEACVNCHEDIPATGFFEHGASEDSPRCLDCHGDPHTIAAITSLSIVDRRRTVNTLCGTCHSEPVGDEEKAAHAVESYEDSMHGRKLYLGSERSPGCIDCHGAHELVSPTDTGSKECAECHEQAGQEFAALVTHDPLTAEDRPVGFYTQKLFAWLTFGTILLLALHILFDLMTLVRRTSAPSPEDEAEPATIPDAALQRFDVHQRLQHGLMASSFTLLVLTGWPLSTHKTSASQGLVEFFGGVDLCGDVHRYAGIALILAVVYHFAYLAVLFKRGQLKLTMLPTLKDFVDVKDNLLHFVGLRPERPRFPRYSYFEKFDYWAVFWGMFIMGGSGLIRWFPDVASQILPAWVYEIAHFAHADEAILAGLAILMWHFYNVHLRPTVFPMSWVFLTGRLSARELREDHGADYDALVASRDPAGASEPEPAAPAAEDASDPSAISTLSPPAARGDAADSEDAP